LHIGTGFKADEFEIHSGAIGFIVEGKGYQLRPDVAKSVPKFTGKKNGDQTGRIAVNNRRKQQAGVPKNELQSKLQITHQQFHMRSQY